MELGELGCRSELLVKMRVSHLFSTQPAPCNAQQEPASLSQVTQGSVTIPSACSLVRVWHLPVGNQLHLVTTAKLSLALT